MKQEWVEGNVPNHFYSYQPCKLAGTLRNSQEAQTTCHIAVYVTQPIEEEVAVNYRLTNFYYSILEFALSWNPFQLLSSNENYHYLYVKCPAFRMFVLAAVYEYGRPIVMAVSIQQSIAVAWALWH